MFVYQGIVIDLLESLSPLVSFVASTAFSALASVTDAPVDMRVELADHLEAVAWSS
jgi:hypothetical protein